MSSKSDRDAIFAQRAGAAKATNKNHTHMAAAHDIRIEAMLPCDKVFSAGTQAYANAGGKDA